jgi:hypothetical protein
MLREVRYQMHCQEARQVPKSIVNSMVTATCQCQRLQDASHAC